METEYDTKGYDLTKVYDYNQYPDVRHGRCDNCDYTLFKSSVKNGQFLRECRRCGMKKSI
ncbi:hypothetical protein OIO07_07475 [Bacillus paralicheniformis]|jgi:hypothetical protein|uniref:DUF8096 domain-containing protein n=1 Tax=Bacillus paralicheniformis TaxID=1648923 RepID=A0ABY3FQ67_9BACI|nr:MULTISPECIES: hypothetical protein [Bacillus]KJD54789.1 hypothetical protein UZ38_25630 [Bacillus amyloliquefaciens]KUL06227.1 hypothetical protein LI7559_21545 [Bacillus licheniformis LMG 7559]AJO19339.1 hypothetical protein SC10_B2orf04519 [Bacillus paralicheniformis]ARA86665.1 hypothetical protein BLMD_14915 [Bacillus paralicheniformis]AYQ17309.1 hypothetical protein D5285_15135 [Bacillus paralicheniformis]